MGFLAVGSRCSRLREGFFSAVALAARKTSFELQIGGSIGTRLANRAHGQQCKHLDDWWSCSTPHPPTHTAPMADSALRSQYYCYGRSRINAASPQAQRATKTSGKGVPREPLSELPGSGPLQGKLKPPARVSLSPTKLDTVILAALEIEPIESPHVACVQQAVEPKETRELNLEQRYAS